jgi:hypothetical protein
MSSETIPEWAREEARKIADVWQHPMHHDHQILSQDIARTLLAAEQRGLEKAAAHLGKMAQETPLGEENSRLGSSAHNWLRFCAAAIRSLGEKI